MRRSVLVFLLLFLLPACSSPVDLPELYPVPDVELTSQDNRPLNLNSFKGSVVIYDFIFTNCPGPCPLMTREMKRAADDLADAEGVRFVSISVDPERDTPAALAEYAKRHGADDRWTFLTGQRKSIIDLSVKGFKLAAGPFDPSSTQPIFHSTKFVLVDSSGMIRGYYEYADREQMTALRQHARALARER